LQLQSLHLLCSDDCDPLDVCVVTQTDPLPASSVKLYALTGARQRAHQWQLLHTSLVRIMTLRPHREPCPLARRPLAPTFRSARSRNTQRQVKSHPLLAGFGKRSQVVPRCGHFSSHVDSSMLAKELPRLWSRCAGLD